MSAEDIKPITVKKVPLILNRNIILNKGIKPLNRNIKVVKSIQNSFKDVIFTSKLGDFTSGEARSMTIVSRHNLLTKSSKTIAKCQGHNGEFFEKTSDEITKLIGQNNYQILFSSICSLFNEELKIRSINSLLTVPKNNKSVSCQTEFSDQSFTSKKPVVETSCQTNETCLDELKKFKAKRRNKRQPLQPYVVRDEPDHKQPRRVVISPSNFDMLFVKDESVHKDESSNTEPSLPELGLGANIRLFDEDSNNSIGRFSSLSVSTTPELMVNPFNILTNVDKHTRDTSSEVKKEISATDCSNIDRLQNMGCPEPKIPGKQFGYKEMLQNAPPEQRVKMLLRQGLIDWKYCLTRDNEGYLPIHVAIFTNNEDLLRRNCLVLKMRDTSVDIPADGLTPLRISLFQENTQLAAILLHFGADPLEADDDDRTVFHVAAAMGTEHLQTLVYYCQQNAKKILQENEELWKPEYEGRSDEELAPVLMAYINTSYDSQGYTPLMLASKWGRYSNVMVLVESCRNAINMRMPNSGNTALYLAVGAACMDSAERGNKAKVVDHYGKTVEILVENGADPSIENFAGISVNDLLTEFNIGELSMLIANKLTSVRYFDGQLPNGSKGSDFMLFKDDTGKVNLTGMNKRKNANPAASKSLEKNTSKSSPVILENIAIKPPVKAGSSTTTVKPNIISRGRSPKLPGDDPIKYKVIKQDNALKNPQLVKNFKLNKPVIIKSELKNNKRKLNIVYDPVASKKHIKTD